MSLLVWLSFVLAPRNQQRQLKYFTNCRSFTSLTPGPHPSLKTLHVCTTDKGVFQINCRLKWMSTRAWRREHLLWSLYYVLMVQPHPNPQSIEFCSHRGTGGISTCQSLENCLCGIISATVSVFVSTFYPDHKMLVLLLTHSAVFATQRTHSRISGASCWYISDNRRL